MNLIKPILADAVTVAAIRRDIHAHSELCCQEERSADVIANALTDWGIPAHRGYGATHASPRPTWSTLWAAARERHLAQAA